MELVKHSLFKGDSTEFIIKTKINDLSAYAVNVYLKETNTNIDDTPFAILGSGTITVTNKDDGAEILVPISPLLSSSFERSTYYYMAKGSISTITKVTLGIGMIVIDTFMGDYFLSRFRTFIKDEASINKGEFLNTIENEDHHLRMYLSQAVDAYNSSYFQTEFTIDNFPSEQILFVGALLQALISNGIINARCALTYQDAGGIIVQDMDRWGRYAQLFSQYYNIYKQTTLESKRSWNIENAFSEVPSDYRYGGFDSNNIYGGMGYDETY